MRAWPRVGSRDSRVFRDIPGESSWTMNKLTLVPERAATMARSAHSASSTGHLLPLSTPSLAEAVIASGASLPGPSAKARQAIDFPEASEGTYRCFCCSVPAARINSAPRQMDDANGTGARARPNSSAITHSSRYPAPVPPYASGMAADRKPTSPSVVHSWRSSGKPASTTLRILEGELRSSRTLRASSLSCSWSEENSKFIAV